MNHQGKLEPLAGLEAKGPLTFVDLANRGAGDLVAVNGVFRNLGQDRFEKTSTEIPAAVAAVASDFDGDGRADIALVESDGSLHLLRNASETKNNWLLAGLNGVKNPKLAPFAKVEIKTGASYQKRIYEGVPLLFGVDSYKIADAVRITLAQRADPE